jgi:ferritin-like protein
MLYKSSWAKVLQMKARITEKEHVEVQVEGLATTDSEVPAAQAKQVCDIGKTNHPELPKLESNEELGLKVVLAALEESAVKARVATYEGQSAKYFEGARVSKIGGEGEVP